MPTPSATTRPRAALRTRAGAHAAGRSASPRASRRDSREADPGIRTDIQGLRAIAVSIVVVYHLAPTWLSGGFVGVDVFFVISGFLITSHLLAKAPRTGRDLATFWSRRIRRLLPASLLVLTTTLVASRFVAPETQWENTARQIRAAALYVVNWLLAGDAVDYLAAEDKPTAVQHFWSLSVEEQFYFVWPVAILLLAGLAALLRRRPAVVVGIGLAAVVAASLAYSITETTSNPAAAYFVTPTRMWELGIGGVLAVLTAPRVLGRDDRPRVPPPGIALVLAWLGIAAIAWTAWTYTGGTPFPGYQAALPVVGAAMVIAGHPRRGEALGPGGVLALRPVQWLGDISYSVYLWHWPLVVLVPYATGHGLDNTDRLGILLATLLLADLTKRYVEDRFRTPQWGRPLKKPYLLGVVGMAVVVGLASLQLAEVHHDQAQARQRLSKALAGDNPCFGARALDPGRRCDKVAFADLLPAPIDAAKDKSQAYKDVGGRNCWAWKPRFRTVRCTFGDTSSPTRIVLVGNSHAGQWLPALQQLAARQHWRIDTYLASVCALSDIPQHLDTPANGAACRSWVRRTTAQVADSKPALVVMANRISVTAEGHDATTSPAVYERGYTAVLHRFAAAGVKVLVLHDTPAPGTSIPDCVAEHGSDYTRCDGTRSSWLPAEPVDASVHAVDDPDIRLADLTDHICADRVCHAVNGGVITYFDASHLTATYARTLAPYLLTPIERLLRP